MSAKEKGVDLKAAALGHRDGNVIVVNSEIQDPSEMKGKTFAIPSTQSSHYILLRSDFPDRCDRKRSRIVSKIAGQLFCGGRKARQKRSASGGRGAATLETSLDWISYQDLAISEEAIYLADRVVILDANPGQIKAVLTIPLGKHRDRTSEDFLAIRDQIFEIFHMKREDAIEYYI